MPTDPLAYRVLVTVTLIALLPLLLIFGTRERWWRHPFGVSLILTDFGLLLYMVATSLRQWLGPEYRGRNVVRFVALSALLLAILVQNVVLSRARRRRKR